MRKVTIDVYKFDELPDSIKLKILDDIRYINVECCPDWHNDIISEFKESNQHFVVTNVYFSGFGNQGDGAMFEYTEITKRLEEEITKELRIPEDLQKILTNDTSWCASGKHGNTRYTHEYTCYHVIDFDYPVHAIKYETIENTLDDIKLCIQKKYQEQCKNLYQRLENEYGYLTSDEAVIETINANDYEYTICGDKYNIFHKY